MKTDMNIIVNIIFIEGKKKKESKEDKRRTEDFLSKKANVAM